MTRVRKPKAGKVFPTAAVAWQVASGVEHVF
jgi:hypothetical protein